MKKQMKQKRGITLIALVITIVVLIILALISMNAILGDSGIFKQADRAQLKSEQGTILEDLRMEMYNKLGNKKYEDLTGLEYLRLIDDEKTAKINNDDEVIVDNVRQGIKSGKGNKKVGDVYYIEEGKLYYEDKDKRKKDLGFIFGDKEIEEVEIGETIFEYEDPEKKIIKGIKPEYITGEESGYNYYSRTLKTINTIKIPDRVEEIKSYAFNGMKGLKRVDLGSGIKKIGIGAFENCYDLEYVKFSDSLKSIRRKSFSIMLFFRKSRPTR